MISKTEIIATLGPSSSSLTTLRKMYASGLDVVRLNFSHGTHLGHIRRIRLIRSLNKKLRRAVKIMMDLEGYRVRTGRLSGAIQLKKRAQFYLSQEDLIGNAKIVPFDYKGSLSGIKKSNLIYIDDGKIVLKVKSVEKKRLKVIVLVGGLLCAHKGINIPEGALEFKAITDKDKKDLKIAIEERPDYIAQSFVRCAQDLRLLKEIVVPRHKKCKFFAKIENPQALVNLDEIIDEADGVIVARGDLGICIPIYTVPVVQKEIIKKCRKKRKPVVVATQMLDSMTEENIPTRAEVSDVATAILDGATHLLLSAETAIGRHPQAVIEMMNKVIKNTEIYERKIKKEKPVTGKGSWL